ncbi:unnamed protein product [Clonostachys byssicola]|uniref:Uncharacterized protein n=1 Tax=Clonostachys byssicola TaxID=160290 RepID=A0A9N9Y9L7_9HYPO|nr:unnamed protein product [Clonostachys byssicola]
MVAAKQLSLAALLWLGLANQGLALGINEATNDLTLMERSPAHKGPMAKVITPGHSAGGPIHHLRDEEEELDTRDEEEIEERDFDELDERDFEELDERDLDIESRGERPGHAPSHGPKKHRRDLEESDLETRSPIRAIPGGTRGSWGGQNGLRRPRDIEARRPPVPGGGRPAPGPIRPPKRIVRDLEDFDLETRSPIRAIPGGTRGSWGGQNGPKRPRDIEARGSSDRKPRPKPAPVPIGGHHSGVLGKKGRDLEDVELEARGSSDRKPRPKPAPVPIGGHHSGVLGKKGRDLEDVELEARGSSDRKPRPKPAPGRGLEESDLETRSPIRAIPGGTRGSWGGQNGPRRPRDIETRSKKMPGTGGRPGVRPRPSGRSLDVRMGGFGKTRGPRLNRPRPGPQ